MSRLDQFYTNHDVAQQCYKRLVAAISTLINNPYFIEPSAGAGAFFDLLPKYHRIGIDIEPRQTGIHKGDFLDWQFSKGTARSRVVVGNPPFGKRGDTAMRFIVRSSEIADTVAFILPLCFTKYLIQRKVPQDLRLIETLRLPANVFQLPNGKPYNVNTEFQIWTRLPYRKDLRIANPPPTSHKDFIMYQYNNTKQALKVFANEFVFAVPCQGWQDYTRKVCHADECEKNKQWMLFNAKGDALDRLHAIDYQDLAIRNATTVPGFRKNDVVREYENV